MTPAPPLSVSDEREDPERSWVSRAVHSVCGGHRDGEGREPKDIVCLLTARPESVADARAFVRTILCSRHCESVVDDVVLAASELVTNAVTHEMALGRRAGTGASIRLGIASRGRAVLCLVANPGLGGPEVKNAGPEAESGRGLQIVAALAEDWGHTLSEPEEDDTAVWNVVWARFAS